MDFETSTQAKSWMFDEESLALCKEQASAMEEICGKSTTARVRKFASGFATRRQQQQMKKQQPQFDAPNNSNKDSRNSAFRSYHSYENHFDRSLLIPTLRHGCPPPDHPRHASVPSTAELCAADQDILVHFHAHQIQRLVGPSALLPELQRSASVLSTAITLFRRFYLSNSVIDFHPRNVAAASALLAVKVDCEPKLEISLLSYATSLVQQKANKAPLCRDELRAVPIEDIEEAERALLAGLNYELRCHHPFGAIRVLSSDLANFLATSASEEYNYNKSYSQNSAYPYGYKSPTTVHDCYTEERVTTLCDRAIAIAQSALVYSDVNFLFPPGQIAFAAVSLALEGNDYGGRLGAAMRSYLRMRFPQKSEEELCQFEWDVTRIISNLAHSPEIDLSKFCYNNTCHHHPSSYHRNGRSNSHSHPYGRQSTHHRATEVRRVFAVASNIRYQRAYAKTAAPSSSQSPVPTTTDYNPTRHVTSSMKRRVSSGSVGNYHTTSKKRSREEYSSPHHWNYQAYKAAKVTPVHSPLRY